MFSDGELLAIEIVERVVSILSLFGAILIISTFTTFPSLRKPINRLVFYATFGNLLTNIATLISFSGIRRGDGSALCIYQGFFIQMFMPADAFWTFCMALNVYLTFFRGYTAKDLRGLEKWYFLVCYGLPFTPALIYVIVQVTTQKHIYGNAAIWCWVSIEHDWMRIAFFYAPVWFIIIITFTIYTITGREILIRRAALREFEQQTADSLLSQDSKPLPSVPATPSSKITPGFGAVTKVTEIQVTSEPIKLEVFNPLTTTRNEASPPTALEPDYDNDHSYSFSSQRRLSLPPPSNPKPQFWWSKPSDDPQSDPFSNPIHDHGVNTNVVTMVTSDGSALKRSPSTKHLTADSSSASTSAPVPHSPPPPLPRSNPDSRMSMFSNNTSLARPPTASSQHARRRVTTSQSANRAAFSYFKVALLMFVALSVVWIPSTVNRIYSLVYPEKQSFVLNLLAAAVLPMQGAWNAAVFLGTSLQEIKRGFAELGEGKGKGRKDSVISYSDGGKWKKWIG